MMAKAAAERAGQASVTVGGAAVDWLTDGGAANAAGVAMEMAAVGGQAVGEVFQP